MTRGALNLDVLESTLAPKLDPRVYVEPKDKSSASENDRQWAWVKFMHEHARRVMVFAVPNGTNISSNAGRAKVKREGLYTGFPDTGAVWTGCVAWIEWKAGRGDPSPAQVEALNRLAAMDHPVAVVRTMEGACAWLRGLGAPVPAQARSFGEIAAGVVARVARGEPSV